MRSSGPVLSVVVLALVALAAHGDPAPPGRPAGDAVRAGQAGTAAVEAVIRGLFDAMRSADSARARALFHPDARLSGPAEQDGEVVLRNTGVRSFLDAMSGAEAEWDERIRHLEIRRDGRLATAWMEYVFYLGGELSHCGVNAVQLYRSEDGWEIFQISDTRRTEGCPDPPGGEG